nr:MAG TPA: hypothetical protein [Bacteriophage sp.]
MTDTQLIIPLMEDALTVATLLIKAGYRVQMRKSKEGTSRYVYLLDIAR